MLIQERYQTDELLADGPFGQTYAARDLQTGGEVVVKQITVRGMAGWKPFELFEREVAVLRSVDHPGVPRVVDAFESEVAPGTPSLVLVLERIPGEPLLALIKRGHRWEEQHARRLLEALLLILDHLHRLSPPVIHRDIKPSNIVLRPDGRPVLVDFGGVHVLATRMGHHSMTVVGTAGYLPPEQAMGAAVPASDLYALGATMVHLLTHTHPADLPRRGLHLRFGDRVGCSDALVRVLEGMVEPDLAARYARAIDVLAALRAPAPAPSRPRPALPPEPTALQRPEPRTLVVPSSPRPVTRAALNRIEGISVLKGVGAATKVMLGSLGTLAFLAGFGLHATGLWAAMFSGLALITASGYSAHRRHRARYLQIYQNGAALAGVVQTIRTMTINGEPHADVRYTYEVDGRTLWGEVHYVGPAVARLEDLPVLVVYDPDSPRDHVSLMVAA